nr:DUF922 domain-containing protein [Hoeflea marina]
MLAAALAGLAAAPARAWEPVEKVVPYAVSGTSGAALYASIGENGPVIGGDRRTIAHTTFKLTWTRDYQKRGKACVLASAVPKLTITYTLPRAGKLPPTVKARWDAFVEGIAAHERVHGAHIIEMVREIEAVSQGLSVAVDPKCEQVRVVLQAHLKRLSDRQRQRGRDFDRIEMGGGGNIQQLILELISGQ